MNKQFVLNEREYNLLKELVQLCIKENKKDIIANRQPLFDNLKLGELEIVLK